MSANTNFGTGPDSQTLQAWGGIVTGTMESWAKALDTNPPAVEAALGALDVDPLVDTAEDKGRAGSERPTAPGLRSLALFRDDAKRLVEEIVGNHRMDN
jgi:hypothetical protein